MNDVGGLVAGRSLRRVTVAAVALALAAVLLTGFGVAQESGSPPELVGGERLSDTAVELQIADDFGVDLDTITEDDFLLSDGRLAGLSVSENGTDAVVELVLDTPIQSDDLTVALAANSTIADVDGNQIDAPAQQRVTVSGMDGVPPTVESFTASNAHASPATLTLSVDERLDTVVVEIRGPEDATLTRSDFERVGPTQYEATFEPSVDGAYEATLVELADESGNGASPGDSADIDVRLTRPEAVASIDIDASTNRTVTLDATHSSKSAVSFAWALGDGTTATGERITHEFAPGVYTVELTATDAYGNTDTDSVTVSVPSDGGSAPGNGTDPTPIVSVDRDTATAAALVSVSPAPAGVTIQIDPDDGQPLLADERVALDGINVTLSRPTGFGLVASTVDPASFERDTVTTISGFALTHNLPTDAVDRATLSVSLSEDVLSSANIDPAQVHLQREGENGWEQLSTTGRKDDDMYRFEATTTEFSRFAVVTTQDSVEFPGSTDDTDSSDSTDGNDATDGDDSQTGDDTDDGSDSSNDAGGADFLVRNLTVAPNATGVGDPVTVNATVENAGDQRESFIAGLFVDGILRTTKFVEPIDPQATRAVEFTPQFENASTYSVRINGTAPATVEVESGGGGGLIATILGIPGTLLGVLPLGFLPLGFLPWGLIRTGLVFVGLPVAGLVLALRGFARYRGY